MRRHEKVNTNDSIRSLSAAIQSSRFTNASARPPQRRPIHAPNPPSVHEAARAGVTVSNVAMSSEGGESKRSVPRSGPRPSPRVGGSGSGANVGRGSGSGSHGGRRTLAKAGSSHVIRIAERRQSTVVKLRPRKSSRRLKVAPAAEEPGVTWVSLCIICVSIWLGLGAMSAAALRAYTEAIDMANEQMLDALGGNVAQEIGGSGTACSCAGSTLFVVYD